MTRFPAFPRIAGWSDQQAVEVVFTGDADPVLPTPLRIGAAAAAAPAATGLAATELWGSRPHYAAGAIGKTGGAGVASEQRSIMGVYPAWDGR